MKFGRHRDRSKAVTYAIDSLPAGDRIVRSVGLERLGQTEIAARVPAVKGHEFDHEVMRVLEFIATYVANSGARISAGQTLAYGWKMFRFNGDRPSVLEIEEDTQPFSPDHPSHFGPGVGRAIALRLAGDAVMRRNRLSGQAEHPNRGHTAMACIHLTENDPGEIVAQRYEINRATSPWGSGWWLHCRAEKHADSDWHCHHLTHLISPRPFVMPYLCMPEGSMVAFDNQGAVVWGVGAENGHRDPEDPRLWRFEPDGA